MHAVPSAKKQKMGIKPIPEKSRVLADRKTYEL
jgi:hypothetical protein